jgi:prevent-host-death family protein
MELVMSASEFKAKCLDVLKRLRDHRISRVTVTHRGKPVAVVGPVSSAVDSDWVSELRRDMKGSVRIAEGVDLTEPIFDGEIEADQGISYR